MNSEALKELLLILIVIGAFTFIVVVIGVGLHFNGLGCSDICSCETSFDWYNETIKTNWTR